MPFGFPCRVSARFHVDTFPLIIPIGGLIDSFHLKNVRTEMSLQVLAYNMKRMIGIFGVKPLIAAIAA
jgi:hypothetical protein